MTLAQWLKNPGPDQYKPITSHPPSIGVHDVHAIEHVRTYLWDLDDYHVESVQAGVIWLAPKAIEERRGTCSFASAGTYGHECGMPATSVLVTRRTADVDIALRCMGVTPTADGLSRSPRCDTHKGIPEWNSGPVVRTEPIDPVK